MDKDRKFIISEKRLRSLLEDELRLIALDAGGVDNWSWYGDSICDFIQDTIKENDLDPDIESLCELVDIDIEDFETIE